MWGGEQPAMWQMSAAQAWLHLWKTCTRRFAYWWSWVRVSSVTPLGLFVFDPLLNILQANSQPWSYDCRCLCWPGGHGKNCVRSHSSAMLRNVLSFPTLTEYGISICFYTNNPPCISSECIDYIYKFIAGVYSLGPGIVSESRANHLLSQFSTIRRSFSAFYRYKHATGWTELWSTSSAPFRSSSFLGYPLDYARPSDFLCRSVINHLTIKTTTTIWTVVSQLWVATWSFIYVLMTTFFLDSLMSFPKYGPGFQFWPYAIRWVVSVGRAIPS